MPVYVRCIEAFSLRVKQLLYVNSCDAAFTVNFEKFNVKIAEKRVGKKKGVLKEKSTNKKRKSGKKGEEAEEIEEEAKSGDENNDEEDEEEDEEEEGNQTD